MSDNDSPTLAGGEAAPGWRHVLRLTVTATDQDGLVAVTADEPRGLLVVGRSIAEALADVPQALADLRDSGAPMPNIGRLNVP